METAACVVRLLALVHVTAPSVGQQTAMATCGVVAGRVVGWHSQYSPAARLVQVEQPEQELRPQVHALHQPMQEPEEEGAYGADGAAAAAATRAGRMKREIILQVQCVATRKEIPRRSEIVGDRLWSILQLFVLPRFGPSKKIGVS